MTETIEPDSRSQLEAARVQDDNTMIERERDMAAKHRVTEMTLDELRCLSNACISELQRRNTIQTAKPRIEQVVHDHAEAVKNQAAKPISALKKEQRLGPGERFIDASGVEWRNQSSQWLSPVTEGPDVQATSWIKTNPPAANPAPRWQADQEINAGDLRLYGGIVWRAISAHTSSTATAPGQAKDLWVKA